MKQLFCASFSACVLFSTACSDEVVVNESQEIQNQEGISMIASDFIIEQASRTTVDIVKNEAVFAWSADDVVGVFPNEGNQVAFPMKKGEGAKDATFDGGGWLLKPTATYMAYYPLIKEFELDKTAVPVNYAGQEFSPSADGKIYTGKSDFMTSYGEIPADGSLVFKFKHVGSLIIMDMTMPNAGELSNVKLSLPKGENLLVQSGTVDLTTKPADQNNPGSLTIQNPVMTNEYSIRVSGVTTQKAGDKVRVCFMMAPVDLSGKILSVVLTVNGTEEMARTVKISKAFEPGVAYAFADPIPVDGKTYEVTEAGSLEELYGSKKEVEEMVVAGNINSADIRFIRSLINTGGDGSTGSGLKELDLSGATIVEGGGEYLNGQAISAASSVSRGNETRGNETEVSVIGPSMFKDCRSLESLILPKNTKSIGESAFAGCVGLTTISIPGSVVSLGANLLTDSNIQTVTFEQGTLPLTFSENTFSQAHLTSFEIPSRVSSIPANCFSGCESITQMTIPGTVTSMDEGAFSGCVELANVQINANLTTLSPSLFLNCKKLVTVNFPTNLESIGAQAFRGCPLREDITLPARVKSIGDYAFSYINSNISRLVLNEGLETIGTGAFYECGKILKVELPASLKNMSDCAFNWKSDNLPAFSNLLEITFKGMVPPEMIQTKSSSSEISAPDIAKAKDCKVNLPQAGGDAYLASKWLDGQKYSEFYQTTGLQCFDVVNVVLLDENGDPANGQLKPFEDGGLGF